MFQPFVKMNPKFVDGFIKLRKIYLVSQSYSRGDEREETSVKEGLLFTDYDDPGMALNHKDAIRNDKYAAMLDLSNPKHKEKLLNTLLPVSKYAVYWGAVMNKDKLKRMLDDAYGEELRHYIDTQTNWSPGRNETVYPVVQVIFGELHLLFKYGSHESRARLDDIIKSY